MNVPEEKTTATRQASLSAGGSGQRQKIAATARAMKQRKRKAHQRKIRSSNTAG